MRGIWTIPVIVSVFILGLMGLPEDAHAIGGTISDQASCEAIGGTWNPPFTCRVTSLTVNSGEILTISQDITLQNDGTIDNGGIIENFGTITSLDGTLKNAGTINNSGTINNFGGLSINSGTIENFGGIINNNAGGTINNAGGTIKNGFTTSGTINNNGFINNTGGTIENFGVINNNRLISSDGTIINNFGGTFTNNAGGSIENFGIITNNAGGTIENFGIITNNLGGSINNNGFLLNFTGTIDNSGTLDNLGTLVNAGTLNIDGDLSSGGSFVNSATGVVNAVQLSSLFFTSDVQNDGSFTLDGVCPAGTGGTLVVGAEKTFDNNGNFDAVGWNLRSDSITSKFNFDNSDSLGFSAICLDIQNSDATLSGAPLVAIDSIDSGGNINWIFQSSIIDSDSDGIEDNLDNCPNDPNPNQENFDGDAEGDVCDADDDNDGVLDGDDNNSLDQFVCQDTDADTCDDCSTGSFDPANDGTDTDADGVCDAGDVCPLDIDNDSDSDKVCLSDGDCNDNDSSINPNTAESCTDGIDNDCDGLVDLADPVCQSPEVCDGLDNDGDGTIDEDFADLGEACSVGVGQCQASGVIVCTSDGAATQCDAIPGAPSVESCDSLDNDCDGFVDESDEDHSLPLTVSCSLPFSGIGECTDGTQTCIDGELRACVDAVLPVPETCDNQGQDNDCDGEFDNIEGLNDACTVGVGQCQADGFFVCTETGLACGATPGEPFDEVCNGLDDDCDGSSDEDFTDLGNACIVGIGACERTGVFVCDAEGGQSCSVTPGEPSSEVCDEIDNDCDGSINENNTGGSVCTIPITIDIKPGSDENPINCKSKGAIPIAIFAISTFDPFAIDLSTVHINGQPASEKHGKLHAEDVDGDGLDDAVYHLDDPAPIPEEGCQQIGQVFTLTLTGSLSDGTPVEGSDEIVVVGSKVKDVVR